MEARAKLNTPGKNDGLNQLWIDGKLEAERRNLDWRGNYTAHGINAVFLEAYWNSASPVTQSRWIDNFVISTEPIGPIVCSRNPVLIKTPYRGQGEQQAWEVEIELEAEHVVWSSESITDSEHVRVGEDNGSFLGELSGQDGLEASKTYYVRVRQQNSAGVWSDWSEWHQPFRVE